MGTTVMVFILLAVIIVICLLLNFNERKQEFRQLKKLNKIFSEKASSRGMAITSQDNFQNCVIGVDAVKRQLLILKFSSFQVHEIPVDLTEVKRCKAKHHFKRSYDGDPDELESAESCSLIFELFDGRKKEVVFENQLQDISHLRDLSLKTSKWAVLLSQLLTNKEDDDPPRHLRKAS